MSRPELEETIEEIRQMEEKGYCPGLTIFVKDVDGEQWSADNLAYSTSLEREDVTHLLYLGLTFFLMLPKPKGGNGRGG